MAANTTSSERQAQQHQGEHLMINTFGRAKLFYDDKEIANSEEKTSRPIGTSDFKFLIRVNSNGSFDIQRRDGVTFNLTLETTTKICQVRARGEDMVIPPWYRLAGDVLQQKYATRPAEFAESLFRVRLPHSSNVFRRVDVRFLQSSWVTLLIHNNQVMSACVNGLREIALLGNACETIATNGTTRAHGLDEKVRKRVDDDQISVYSTSSAVSRRPADDWSTFPPTTSNNREAGNEIVDMPSLIPNVSIDSIREKYIRELEMALATIKMPKSPNA